MRRNSAHGWEATNSTPAQTFRRRIQNPRRSLLRTRAITQFLIPRLRTPANHAQRKCPLSRRQCQLRRTGNMPRRRLPVQAPSSNAVPFPAPAQAQKSPAAAGACERSRATGPAPQPPAPGSSPLLKCSARICDVSCARSRSTISTPYSGIPSAIRNASTAADPTGVAAAVRSPSHSFASPASGIQSS